MAKSRNTPNNIEVEIAILGCIILDNSVMPQLIDQVSADDFYDVRNQTIYKTMCGLYDEKQAIDFTTLINRLTLQNEFGKAGGTEFISNLVEAVPTTSNIDTYVAILKDLSIKRKLIDASLEISSAGYDINRNSNDYIDYAEKVLQDIIQKRSTSSFRNIEDVTINVKQITEENTKKIKGITGLYTGFSNLDNHTLGLQPESLLILAARPAMGKSAFAMNLATQVASKNRGIKGDKAVVAVFSLEMGAEQLVSRMLSSEANIEQDKIKKGDMTSQEWRKFEAASQALMNLKIYFDDSASVTVNDIRAKCRKLYQDEGLDLVVIDYLQLIKGEGRNGNRQEEVSNISRGLKQLARELKIPVIALSQLSRDVEKREDKKPIMADLRESGSIEQDADIVMFLYRDEYYNKDKSSHPGEAELIIAKNRSGSTGTLHYLFEGSFARFKIKAEDYLQEH